MKGIVQCVLAGALAFTFVSPLQAFEPGDILIDELFYDAVGADTGQEYIILYNATDTMIDLEWWRIQDAGLDFTFDPYIINGDVEVEAGETFVIGGDLMDRAPDLVINFTFPNGGSASDGVRVVAPDETVSDTLIYDAPNTSALPGDGGFDPYPDAMCAPDVPAGRTLTRDAAHTDTDDCAADFTEGDPLGACPDADGDGHRDAACGRDDCDDTDPAVNPGADEACDNGIDDDCDGLVDDADLDCIVYAPGDILIDELYYDAPGTDTGQEYLILYNNTELSVDLEGWEVQWAGTSFDSGSFVIPAVEVPAGETILLGGDLVSATPDVLVNFFFQGGGTASDGVRIVDPAGTVIDTVIYDAPNENQLPGDGGLDPYPDALCAPDVPAGKVLTRDAAHTDTDDCAADFTLGDPLGFCPDTDGDGYDDEACGGDDCDDTDPAVSPDADEICDNGIDDDCDGLADSDDPDCPAEPLCVLDMAYDAGTLSLAFTIGTPSETVWANYLILTVPSVTIVPLWTLALPAIDPAVTVPVTFPFPQVGLIGWYTGLFEGDVPTATDFETVDTGFAG